MQNLISDLIFINCNVGLISIAKGIGGDETFVFTLIIRLIGPLWVVDCS